MTIAPPSAGTDVSVTQEVWAAFLISQINALGGNVPYTKNNVDNIVLWMTSEEPPANWWDRNNPLNASLGTNSSDGTGSYANLTAGAIETATMINQSNMKSILSALEADAPTPVFTSAVVGSPWASGHYANGTQFASTLPGEVVAGSAKTLLPADPGAVVPASPTPLGPLGAGVNVGGNLTGLGGLEAGIDAVLTDLTSANWWARLGLFVGGGALVIIGIIVFISTTKTGQKVESDAVVAAAA